jgi:hypothetical protein
LRHGIGEPIVANSTHRRLLATSTGGADVDNATYSVLEEVSSLCQPNSGCTCFGIGAALARPVCNSTWATCDGQGNLVKLYLFASWSM